MTLKYKKMTTKYCSFDINCENATVNANNTRTVSVTIDNCEKEDILELATDSNSISDIISHIGEDKVLDSIGREYIKDYFNLTEIE